MSYMRHSFSNEGHLIQAQVELLNTFWIDTGGTCVGDHHVASACESHSAVGHGAQRDGVCGLGGPNQAQAHLCDWHDQTPCAPGAQSVLQWRSVHHLPGGQLPAGGGLNPMRHCFLRRGGVIGLSQPLSSTMRRVTVLVNSACKFGPITASFPQD